VKRILFDHCVPKPLRRRLPGFEIRTCFEQGWDALRNGELLLAAEAAGFQIFVTADKKLRNQQDLRVRQIAILELPRNRLAILLQLVDEIEQALAVMEPGGYVVIPRPSLPP
jgi:hypothetical protein